MIEDMKPKTPVEWGSLLGILLIFLVLLFSNGCNDSSTPNVGKDDYQFTTPEYQKKEVIVKLITYKTKEEFLDSLRKENKKEFDKNVAAYSVIIPSQNVCEIHIIEPQTEYIPEFMGHEAYHCFYGQFHKDNDSR